MKYLIYLVTMWLLLLLVGCQAAEEEIVPTAVGEVDVPIEETQEEDPPQQNNGNNNDEEGNAEGTILTTANLDGVFVRQGGADNPLLAPNNIAIGVGDGVDVDEVGHAILEFPDLFVVEVLRDGELIVQEASLDDVDAIVAFSQIGGAVINDFQADEALNRRLTIETEFATITATGTRFLIAKEANTPLEWIVGLDAEPGDLMITADGVTKEVTNEVGRWVAPIGEPSPSFAADVAGLNEWVDNLKAGNPVEEIGEVLWAPADELVNTTQMPAAVTVGEAFNMGNIVMTLDPAGTYERTDCNGDGWEDIEMRNGSIRFDLRNILGRVRSLDVTILNHGEPGSGVLTAYNPAGPDLSEPLSQTRVSMGAEMMEVLSLRSAEEPYHFGNLTLDWGCFLGLSITPPKTDGSSGDPRPAVELTESSQTDPGNIVLGRSVQGNEITAAKFGDGQNSLIFVGGIHAGFSPSSIVLAERAIAYFEQNPEAVPANTTLYVVPNLNPDAVWDPGETPGRLNANGVDLNRNWGCNWSAEVEFRNEPIGSGTAAFSEPETQALAGFAREVNARAVVFWGARAQNGAISPGECGRVTADSNIVAQLYRRGARGYSLEDFDLSGNAIDWLTGEGISAVFVLLPSYTEVSEQDWSENLAAMLTTLEAYDR